MILDPVSPTEAGEHLTLGLADWLDEHTGERWDVEVATDPRSAQADNIDELMEVVDEIRIARGWRYALCVTDLPLLLRSRPVIAQRDTGRGVAVISMPALGPLMQRRLKRVAARMLGELLGDRGIADAAENQIAMASVDDAGENGVRYTKHPAIAWPLLVVGMVRANRPWNVVFGLSSAMAAALATSAFGLSSTTIWQIGDMLTPDRRVFASLLAMTILVSWLIFRHGLWERVSERERRSHRLVGLYNAATLVTLSIGVAALYAGLFVMNFAIAWFLVPEALLEETLLRPPSFTSYLGLAWGFSTMGVLAGAVGSSFESEASVRQVAYGQREKYRLRSIQDTEPELGRD
ncbi:hypothetical protein F8O04_14195 [Pseudoclavibacter endophyticus]|uniref:5,10-methylene-tetrahydrofolate dehydrogenase n=1 Tax=Pseudoclavibacter endophyticus TaxID=1778590 RepID=A0A6H9WJF9_9MICO|nr:hypothetical protein F8O04_14195 [Pseudoclavibacter endophyticus]